MGAPTPNLMPRKRGKKREEEKKEKRRARIDVS
jgi:hypothetical protein